MILRLAIGLAALSFALMFAALYFEQRIKAQERNDGVPYYSDEEFNWAIQGQDGAIDGCPGQYHQYAEVNNGHEVLIGCWGKK